MGVWNRRKLDGAALGVLVAFGAAIAVPAGAQTTQTSDTAVPAANQVGTPAASTVVAKTSAGVTATSVVAASTTPPTSRYSDPLADTAGVALAALRGRPSLVPAAFTASAPAVIVAAPAQTQVTGGQVVPPAPGAGQSWTSITLDTDQVGDYLVGTQIVVPVAPATEAALRSLPTEASGRYQAAIHQVAVLVASRISGATAAELERAWARTDDRRMTVLLTALAQVGTMYRYTGNEPGGFDCSGLTSYSWARAGVKIPRTSGDQINAAGTRDPANLQVGDLMYRPGHIGLSLGVSDYMVHSPQTGKPVEVKHSGRMTRFGTPI